MKSVKLTTGLKRITTVAAAFSVLSLANALSGESIAISPDAKLIAVGKNDGTIELRGSSDYQLKATLKQLEKPPHPASAVRHTPNLVFSPDGKMLASAVGASGVALWDVERRQKIKKLPMPSVGYDLTISPDGSRLAGIGVDSKVGPHRFTLWDTASGKVVKTMTIEMILGKRHASSQFVCAEFKGYKGVLALGSIEAGKPVMRLLNPQTGEESAVMITTPGTGIPEGLEKSLRGVSERLEDAALEEAGMRVKRSGKK